MSTGADQMDEDPWVALKRINTNQLNDAVTRGATNPTEDPMKTG